MSSVSAVRRVAASAAVGDSMRTCGSAEQGGAGRTLAWAIAASTLHRIRRGEGALLAVNLSLIAWHGDALAASGLWQALVSALAIFVMYAFNDLHDAPVDGCNPKKDRVLVRVRVAHRRTGVTATSWLGIATLVIAAVTLGAKAAAAAAAVMVVNAAYSTRLKGVPVADVVAVWAWGALYAAIVAPPFPFVFLIGVMTGICHLFQTLDDRAADAASGIATTAVRSSTLPRSVLAALTLVLFGSLHGLLGAAAAVTAVVPLAIYFAVADAGAGWLLVKAYFAAVWLALLGFVRAAG
ncbi:MAG: hypothetical protein B6D46_09255 [Polyangiaceae bacterium UTPRO1]|jgi:4-hydroxybenzoate polyprenyltransferase|nr:UbiA family prenyltransferase [Myxococcales bacterium]OQY66637.1 MAG: hypothetical protein B6D46_09255 [Polyangiaceae bacterium UTPRO1]